MAEEGIGAYRTLVAVSVYDFTPFNRYIVFVNLVHIPAFLYPIQNSACMVSSVQYLLCSLFTFLDIIADAFDSKSNP